MAIDSRRGGLEDLRFFAGREEEIRLQHALLSSETRPPALMFYGPAGCGKTTLLQKLHDEVRDRELPLARVDFDGRVPTGRAEFLYPIRHELGGSWPCFDLQYGAWRHKSQGARAPQPQAAESADTAWSLFSECAALGLNLADLVDAGTGLTAWLIGQGRTALTEALKKGGLDQWLMTKIGWGQFVALQTLNAAEVEGGLTECLARDLENRLLGSEKVGRAAKAVVYIDTLEVFQSGSAKETSRRLEWVQDLVRQARAALFVLAGQNELRWAGHQTDWSDPKNLLQRSVEGVSAGEAQELLRRRQVEDDALVLAILRASRAGGTKDRPRYSCWFLGNYGNAARREVSGGKAVDPSTFDLPPGDWYRAAERSLQSLTAEVDRQWIRELALTPRFDLEAATAWRDDAVKQYPRELDYRLRGYSLIEDAGDGWLRVRREACAALARDDWAQRNGPEAHQRWREYWNERSESPIDHCGRWPGIIGVR